MNKGKLAFLLVALSTCLWFAPRACGEAAAPSASTNHSLWKIEGSKSTVYLLGSVHMLKQSDLLPLPVLQHGKIFLPHVSNAVSFGIGYLCGDEYKFRAHFNRRLLRPFTGVALRETKSCKKLQGCEE